jgi:hypothetical protein
MPPDLTPADIAEYAAFEEAIRWQTLAPGASLTLAQAAAECLSTEWALSDAVHTHSVKH